MSVRGSFSGGRETGWMSGSRLVEVGIFSLCLDMAEQASTHD
jgi:hypothetical protein